MVTSKGKSMILTELVKASGTRAWIRRRAKQKGYFNNIVLELRIEDTGGYKAMLLN